MDIFPGLTSSGSRVASTATLGVTETLGSIILESFVHHCDMNVVRDPRRSLLICRFHVYHTQVMILQQQGMDDETFHRKFLGVEFPLWSSSGQPHRQDEFPTP
jgi:hypothetical protein